MLNQVTPKPDEVRSESAHQNRDKNRNMEFLPRKCDLFINGVYLWFWVIFPIADKYRVVLKGSYPDYINAAFANVSLPWS